MLLSLVELDLNPSVPKEIKKYFVSEGMIAAVAGALLLSLEEIGES
jgi:hypothetical protein